MFLPDTKQRPAEWLAFVSPPYTGSYPKVNIRLSLPNREIKSSLLTSHSETKHNIGKLTGVLPISDFNLIHLEVPKKFSTSSPI